VPAGVVFIARAKIWVQWKFNPDFMRKMFRKRKFLAGLY
jgi:hypothetical protein